MNREKKRIIFLDRDGVLTVEKGYVSDKADLEIFPYVPYCIEQMHKKGYSCIVITNQSGVARGIIQETELLGMNHYLQQETGVDAIYYCPHHPTGAVEKYRMVCNCRKPGTGMIERACKDFGIYLQRDLSFMVGDRAGDILAGKAAGIKTVLLESGYGIKRLEADVDADYVLNDLRNVLDVI